MKKILLLAILSVTCALMLIGCDQLFSPKEPKKIAKVEDFETHFYESDRYTIYLDEDKLIIYGALLRDNKKSILNEVVVSDDMDSPFVHREFTNAKIKVKGDKYFITADDDVSLEFTKFMDHIIVDSEGMEYIRKKK